MTKYNQARKIRNDQIMQEYERQKKYKKKGHTAQELFDDYKEKICSECINKNVEDCDIHIRRNITVVCENYKKG